MKLSWPAQALSPIQSRFSDRSPMLLLPRLLGLGLLAFSAFAFAIEEEDLLPVDEAFIPNIELAGEQANLSFKIAPGYYLYQERIQLEMVRPQEVTLGELKMPKGEPKSDEFFGDMHVYHNDVQGSASLTYKNGTPVVVGFKLKYQGCADAGVCYPPQARTFAMNTGAGVPSAVDTPVDAGTSAAAGNETNPVNSTAIPQLADPNVQTISGITDANPSAPNPPDAPLMDPAAGAPPADPLGLNAPVGTSPQVLLGSVQDALPEEEAFKATALAIDGQTVLVRIVAPKDYYLYRDKFAFVLSADGVSATPETPVGQPFKDEHFGDVEVYFGGVDIPLKLTRTSGAPTQATLAIEFQGCKKDVVCYPVMRRVMRLDLPSSLATNATAVVPVPATRVEPSSAPTAVATRDPKAEVLPQLLTPAIMLDAINRAVGKGGAIAANTSSADVGLLVALLFAFGGGVLLNLMPCVLPVLSLKVLGLVESGHSPQTARKQAIFYTLGVLVSFLILGLILLSFKAAGTAMGWGFQLQNPLIVVALAMLLIAMGLNLSGVVSFGHSFGNLGGKLDQAGGARGAFFSGVLACIVATPCTGPGMFTALGYGFTQSNAVALVVLLTLGLGLAFPFLIIGLIPKLAARLPRPGAWMETLKNWLAFPLYLTAVWLLSVLGEQTGIAGITYALFGAVLLAAGFWWLERQRFSSAEGAWLGKLFAAGLLISGVYLAYIGADQKMPKRDNLAEGQIPYSASALAELRAAGKPVFVDMTAAWCITCKVNEKNAINTYAVGRAMEENGVAFMVGDYTNSDPAITAYLKAYGAVGVPLYVMYPKSAASP
jgi:thiol:disulfide interchange protein